MSSKAESRLIYNSISTSERVASLGVKGALLFTWLIPHCDSQGRMQGKPRVVKQTVLPFFDDITTADTEEALEMMESQKLVKRYEDSTGRPLIQVVDWWDWQTGLKYKAASHYEAPEGWEDRITHRENGRFAKEEGDKM